MTQQTELFSQIVQHKRNKGSELIQVRNHFDIPTLTKERLAIIALAAALSAALATVSSSFSSSF